MSKRRGADGTGSGDGNDDDAPPPDRLAVEYEQVNENFRMLADIRFKLLALVPALGGAAIYMLTTIGDAVSADEFSYWKVILVGSMGFCATLGITFYDQRNSELYNALSGRAKFLEKELGLPLDDEAAAKVENPVELRASRAGGQFRERPRRGRHLFGLFEIGHDKGLALIYGTVLGGWFFPVLFAGARIRFDRINALRIAFGVTALMIIVAVVELLRHDRRAAPNGQPAPDEGAAEQAADMTGGRDVGRK